MKLDRLVNVVIIIRFILPVLRFAVESGQKGHCHGELDERRLQFLLVVHKLRLFCIGRSLRRKYADWQARQHTFSCMYLAR
jgi:hypothetical protein